jgi:hypothetical protein
MGGESLRHLLQVRGGQIECPSDLIDRSESGSAQSGVHEHAKRVIGMAREPHGLKRNISFEIDRISRRMR